MPAVTVITDEDIKSLIRCKKSFIHAPQKPVQVNKNISQKFFVSGNEGQGKFQVFITHSQRLLEDFSLGLMYDNMLLLRCNGFHGTTKAGFFLAEHHAHPHVHILSIDDINNGRSLKPSTIIDCTGKYVNLQTAISFFCEGCGIIGYEKYFDVNQLQLEI